MESAARREKSFGGPFLLLFCAVWLLAGDALNPPRDQWSAKAAVFAIDAYRATLSPLLARTRLIRCRFEPTCSEYGREAVQRFGLFRGGTLAVWRILRCNPFSRGGYDPVPEADLTPLPPLHVERGWTQGRGRGWFSAEKSAGPSRSRSS